MTRDIHIYLTDILDSIDLILAYTKSVSLEDFQENIMMQDAVCRRLEVIGESVKNIPIHIRDQFLKIPWRDIAGLRDKKKIINYHSVICIKVGVIITLLFFTSSKL